MIDHIIKRTQIKWITFGGDWSDFQGYEFKGNPGIEDDEVCFFARDLFDTDRINVWRSADNVLIGHLTKQKPRNVGF